MRLRLLAPPGVKIIDEEGRGVKVAKYHLEIHVEASDLTVAMLERVAFGAVCTLLGATVTVALFIAFAIEEIRKWRS